MKQARTVGSEISDATSHCESPLSPPWMVVEAEELVNVVGTERGEERKEKIDFHLQRNLEREREREKVCSYV